MKAHIQLRQLFNKVVSYGYIIGVMMGCLCCSTLYACADDKLPLDRKSVV